MRITSLAQSGFLLLLLLCALLGSSAAAGDRKEYRLGPFPGATSPTESDVLVTLSDWAVDFRVEDPAVVAVRVRITSAAKALVFDSGVQPGSEVQWDLATVDWPKHPGPYHYVVSAWASDNRMIGDKIGELNVGTNSAPPDLALSVPGNFTIGGYLGVGTDTPQRAIHVTGPNAVLRLDRSADTASFLLVRTDEVGNPIKSFVVGVNASGANQGEFIINDLGSAVGGGGQRRMTISSDGQTIFNGNVTAQEYFVPSSIRFKEEVRRVEDPIGKLEQLEGVRFNWKNTGAPGLGVIAEEVAKVLPEAVSWDEGRNAVVGVNYDGLVALLIETTKVQQDSIESLKGEIDQIEIEMKAQLERSRRLLAAHGEKEIRK